MEDNHQSNSLESLPIKPDADNWLTTTPTDEIVSSFRVLMLQDFDRAMCIFEGLKKALSDPVLSTLAAMPTEDELTAEEMEREIEQAINASETEERISAEDAKREILG